MENKEKPGYLFQLAYDLGQGKNLSVSGNFMAGATAADMRTEMDKVFEAMDHQRLKRMELPTAEQALDEQTARLEQERLTVQKFINKSQNGKLNTHDAAQFENSRVNIEYMEQNVKKGNEFIAALRKKAE